MKNHRHLGHISIHHLVPKQRLRDYYGITFCLPKNKLKLWREKHTAWHILFKNKTLNEIIRYLGNRPHKIKGYKGRDWFLLFRNKNRKEVQKILKRLRKLIRKKYAHLELDKKLKEKVERIINLYGERSYARLILNQRFTQTA